jgi:hypothetical protein
VAKGKTLTSFALGVVSGVALFALAVSAQPSKRPLPKLNCNVPPSFTLGASTAAENELEQIEQRIDCDYDIHL